MSGFHTVGYVRRPSSSCGEGEDIYQGYMGCYIMKAVTGGMFWTILVIAIGIAMILLFWLFLTGVGEGITPLFNQMVESLKETIKGLIGPLGWILGD